MKTLIRALFISFISVSISAADLIGQSINKTDDIGLKHGKWEKRYPNGNVRYKGQFKDGEPFGVFQYFYKNGKLKATNNHVGDATVANHVYHTNGKIKAKGAVSYTHLTLPTIYSV